MDMDQPTNEKFNFAQKSVLRSNSHCEQTIELLIDLYQLHCYVGIARISVLYTNESDGDDDDEVISIAAAAVVRIYALQIHNAASTIQSPSHLSLSLSIFSQMHPKYAMKTDAPTNIACHIN